MVAGLAVLSLAGLLTACSSGSSTATTGSTSPAASSASSPGPSGSATSAPSATPATTGSASGTAAADGAIAGDQLASQVRAALAAFSSVTITANSTATPQRMLVSYSASGMSFRSTTPAKGFDHPVDGVAELIDPTTLRNVSGVLFMATNPAKLPKAWLRITPSATDEWGTFLRTNLSATLRNMNPNMVATMFSAADSVWQRPADGPGTTRYQVVLKDENILKVMSADDAERLRSAVTGLTQICEIVLDDQRRPVSLSISVSGSSVTQSQTYAGWGSAVTITAPASADVMDTPMLSTLGYSTSKVQLSK